MWNIFGFLMLALFVFFLFLFLGKKHIFILLLIFVFLLPRAGFIIPQILLPLPIGYVIVAILVIKYLISKVVSLRIGEHKIYNPIARSFLFYLVISLYPLVNGIIYNADKSVIFLELSFYVFSFFIYFALIRILAKESFIDLFIKGIVIISLLVSIYGILVYFIGAKALIGYVTYTSTQTGALGALEYYKRTLSSYGDPNVLGAQLVIFCAILFTILFFVKASLSRTIFILIALSLNSVCLLLTESRGALIGLGVSVVMIFIFKFRKSWLIIPLVVFIVTLILIQPASLYERHRVFDKDMMSSDARLSFGSLTKDIIINIPLGAGFGITMNDFNNTHKADSIWDGYNSFYLQLLSKVGILGLGSFLLMLFLMLKYFIGNLRFIEDPLRKNFVLGASIGIIGAQVSWYANNIYMLPGGMLNFWMLCAMLTVVVSFEKEKYLANKKNV